MTVDCYIIPSVRNLTVALLFRSLLYETFWKIDTFPAVYFEDKNKYESYKLFHTMMTLFIVQIIHDKSIFAIAYFLVDFIMQIVHTLEKESSYINWNASEKN